MSYLEELLPAFRNGAKIRSSMWSKKAYIHLKDGKILDESGLPYTIPAIAFHINDWELYQEPVDCDYIIKNKCLCWFWDDDDTDGVMAILVSVYKDSTYRYYCRDLAGSGSSRKYFRPVRRDEVTFYEDVEK
mgnify:CR=1 FL=1